MFIDTYRYVYLLYVCMYVCMYVCITFFVSEYGSKVFQKSQLSIATLYKSMYVCMYVMSACIVFYSTWHTALRMTALLSDARKANTCMYVCMYVCTVYTHVCMYVCIPGWMSSCAGEEAGRQLAEVGSLLEHITLL